MLCSNFIQHSPKVANFWPYCVTVLPFCLFIHVMSSSTVSFKFFVMRTKVVLLCLVNIVYGIQFEVVVSGGCTDLHKEECEKESHSLVALLFVKSGLTNK